MSDEVDYVSKAFASARYDSTGAHYWVRGQPVTREEYERATWTPGNPIWYALLDELNCCYNCCMPKELCGCCGGCGEPDADVDGYHHGYACVM